MWKVYLGVAIFLITLFKSVDTYIAVKYKVETKNEFTFFGWIKANFSTKPSKKEETHSQDDQSKE